MKGSRLTETQIASVLYEADAGGSRAAFNLRRSMAAHEA